MKEQCEPEELTRIRDSRMEQRSSEKNPALNSGQTFPKRVRSRLFSITILPAVPIPVFLIFFLILAILDIRTVFEPLWLLPTSNVLFLFVVPLAVVYIATRGYLQSGSITLLMVGVGTLSLGLGAFLAGSVLIWGGPNHNVTVYNLSVLLSAIFYVLGATLSLIGLDPQKDTRRKKLFVTLTYLSVGILLTLLASATLKSLLPVFFVQGEGPTALRQTVLGTAAALFIVSGLFLAGLYLLSRTRFLYWYLLGLFLIATGLLCVLFQKSVGSPIGWLGRGSQYLGGIYLLVAVVYAWQDLRIRGLTMPQGIAELFRHRLTMLVEERTSQLRRANEQLSNEVAERKKVEDALHESEHMLRAILSTSPVGIALTKKRRIEWTNEVWKQMFGFENEHEYLGRDARTLYLSDEEYQHAGKMLYHDIETGTVGETDTKFRRKDGSVFDAHVKVKALNALDPAAGAISAISDISSRKQAEEALRESEGQKQAILDGITANIAFVNQGLEIKWVNKTAAESVGKLPSQMIGHKCHEYWADPAKPCDGCPTMKAFNTKRSEHKVMVTPDGRAWDERGEPVFDSHGKLIGVVEIANDITEPKRAEEALRESEEKLRIVTETIEDVFWVTTPDLHETIYVSPAYERIWGRTRDSLHESPKSFMESIHPEDRGPLLRVIEEHQDRAWAFEYRIVRPDGTIRWIHDRCYPTLDDNGKVRMRAGVATDITGRKKTEEALRQSEEKFFKAFHASPDVLVISHRDTGRIIETNEKWESIFGYNREETIGRSSLEMGLIENPEVRSNVIRKLEQQGFVRDYEVNIQKKSGEIGQTLLSAESIEIGGEPCVLTVVHDITERKRAEEALRTSEAQLSNAVVIAHLGHWEYDVATDLFTFNDHFYKIFRTTVEQVGGYTMSSEEYARQFVHPDDIHVVADETRKAIETSDPFFSRQFEHRMLYADGEIGYIAVRFFVVKDNTGRTIKTYGVNQDVTERKRVEEALSESEARYRVLFNDSKDGVYITERDGTIIEANQAYFDLLGYTRDEIVGADVRNFYVIPFDRDRFVEAIEPKGFLRDYPLRFRRKDGKEIDCLLTSSLRRAADGTVLGYHGIMRDVTEQKNLQRQLLQAQKMEAIGTLAGGIAHDFNNLLTVVQGFSEVLLAEKEQEQPEYADLRKIFEAARSGADLVQRLLMFSRKSEPNPVPMNLNKQIVQVEKLLRHTIPRMVDIHLDLSPDLPEITADPSQVEQVLMNLAVNARDAMPDKGKLTVGTYMITLDEEYCRSHVDAGPGNYVVLEVADTGHGMNKETVEHIFEPFFTTKEMGRGTGLGLAMVYGIVKQHNGHITVYSEVGRGTTFRVYFPATPGEVEPEVQDSNIALVFGTETVLLVDDEEFVSELGARILTKHGYTVLHASNGREALNLFRKERSQISLVILDLIMPEMGGTECLKELRKIDPNVKVLVASGYSADASVKETIQIGAKGFVSKPFRVKELLRDVRKVLDEG